VARPPQFPNVAPGGNFRPLPLGVASFPTGKTNNNHHVSPSQLEGPNDTKQKYFYTDTTDGSMNGLGTPEKRCPPPLSASSFRAAPSCVEIRPPSGALADGTSSGNNTAFDATVSADVVPDTSPSGQIHLDNLRRDRPSPVPSCSLLQRAAEIAPFGSSARKRLGRGATVGFRIPLATVKMATSGANSIDLNGSRRPPAVHFNLQHDATSPEPVVLRRLYKMYFQAGDSNQ